MFLEQLPVPLLLLVPIRVVRQVAVLFEIPLQIGIMLTGNYNWFNLHTLVLLIPAWVADEYGDLKEDLCPSRLLRFVSAPQRLWQQWWTTRAGHIIGAVLGGGVLVFAFFHMFTFDFGAV